MHGKVFEIVGFWPNHYSCDLSKPIRSLDSVVVGGRISVVVIRGPEWWEAEFQPLSTISASHHSRPLTTINLAKLIDR